MALSGVHVSTNVLDHINDMRLGKENDQRIRILQIGFQNAGTKDCKIEVENKFTQKDLCGEDVFVYLRDKVLEKDKCTYVLYDCQYETKDTGCKKELVFIMWCPEGSKIADKMQFASSKDALKAKMEGIKHRLEITDHNDICTKKVFADSLVKGDNITSMEGEKL